MTPVFIVLNAGSSSLKFQVFEAREGGDPSVVFKGLFEGLGNAARFVAKGSDGAVMDEKSWEAGERIGHEEALMHLVAWLRGHREGRELVGVGHRIVHGGEAFSGAVLVDDATIKTLEAFIPLAPLHQPHNLEPVRIVRRRLPTIPQVACFDTAFHRRQPEIAQMFALPREMRESGVRRYGFHGLSYDFIASVLPTYDRQLAKGRVVVAHLGSGASLCALKNGESVATTMGFSALDGLPMGTRCGAIDPAVVSICCGPCNSVRKKPSASSTRSRAFSGFPACRTTCACCAPMRQRMPMQSRLSISSSIASRGRSVRLSRHSTDLTQWSSPREFGENDIATRAEVIAGLGWAGLKLDEAANRAGGPRISTGPGPGAWVVPTNEELVIARQMQVVLAAAKPRLAS